jgi:alpha-ketoglutarate-dependent taurine dioxygenase
MEQAKGTPALKRGLGELRRKAVDVAATGLVKTRRIRPDSDFPLMAEPAAPGVDLAEWAAANRAQLEADLLKHGAILFRGFGIDSPAAFERAAQAMCPELFSEYGDLPREGVGVKVYGATPYPPDKAILFHNEGSHLPNWPRKQFFLSLVVAEQGGETPLLDVREVYRKLDPELLEKFRTKGLTYIRNFVPGVDVPWQEFFKTEDRTKVEELCRQEGMTCEWTAGGGLRVSQHTRAVWKHPKTGEPIFFNQIQLHHPYCLGEDLRASMRSLFKDEDLPRNVHFGDGTPIDDATMEYIDKLYWELCVAFPWQVGDMIMVDNMLVAHARKPYVGPRKICVAMGEMVRGKDLLAV